LSSKAKAIVFWVLILGSVAFLSRTLRQNPKGFLRIGAFVVPIVLLTLWFTNRFSGRRRRTATIAVEAAIFAIAAGAGALWEFLLLQRGFGGYGAFVAAVGVFLLCTVVSVWSFLRLRRSTPA
jgi:hypothetical protein